MDMSTAADTIIVYGAIAGFVVILYRAILAIAEEIGCKVRNVKRMRKHDAWVAARRGARIATEARLRAEGRWDNYEVQDAMTKAGEAVWPGHRA